MTEDNGTFFDAALMERIRDRFAYVESDPYCGKRVYLENIGGSLTLKTVVDVVARLTALPDNAGRVNPASREVDRLIGKGLQDVGLLLGARSGTVALGESTTSNAFKVLAPIVRSVPGGNLVTTNLDHPSLLDATRIIADRFGKQWRVAELCPRTGTVKPDAVLEHVDADTVVLAMIHSSNVLGTTNDVAETIRRARKIKPDLYVLVDGVQHTPHGLVDVEELQCDAYLASSYKMFSKVGGSVVWLSDRASRLPHDKLLGKPETYWEQGTRETAMYAAWSEVIEYLCWLGGRFTESSDRRGQIVAAMEAITRHERALTWRLLHGDGSSRGLLEVPGVTVYGEVDDLAVKDPALAIGIEGMPSGEAVSYFAQKGIIVHNRISDAYSKHTLAALGIEDCVRVSLCHYNTAEEVDAFLAALEQMAE